MNLFSTPRRGFFMTPDLIGHFEADRNRASRKRVANSRRRAREAKRHKQQMRREGKL